MFTKYLGCFPRFSFSPKSQHLARMYDAILIRKPFGILLLSYFLKRYSSNQKVQPRLRKLLLFLITLVILENVDINAQIYLPAGLSDLGVMSVDYPLVHATLIIIT